MTAADPLLDALAAHRHHQSPRDRRRVSLRIVRMTDGQHVVWENIGDQLVVDGRGRTADDACADALSRIERVRS
jgi:hypothetical protein